MKINLRNIVDEGNKFTNWQIMNERIRKCNYCHIVEMVTLSLKQRDICVLDIPHF